MKNGGTGNAMCKIGGLYVKCENLNNITRKAVELCYIQPSGTNKVKGDYHQKTCKNSTLGFLL